MSFFLSLSPYDSKRFALPSSVAIQNRYKYTLLK